jgi:beta-galactosidase/beta-glucuronidase
MHREKVTVVIFLQALDGIASISACLQCSGQVDNPLQPNSQWYSGSGIYRHVWLNIAGPVHIAQRGTYITTPPADSTSATVSVRTSVQDQYWHLTF